MVKLNCLTIPSYFPPFPLVPQPQINCLEKRLDSFADGASRFLIQCIGQEKQMTCRRISTELLPADSGHCFRVAPLSPLIVQIVSSWPSTRLTFLGARVRGGIKFTCDKAGRGTVWGYGTHHAFQMPATAKNWVSSYPGSSSSKFIL